MQNYAQCSPFMYGDAADGSVAVEDTFDVFFRQNESVEISDEDSRIDWSWIARVCHVTDLAHRTQKNKNPRLALTHRRSKNVSQMFCSKKLMMSFVFLQAAEMIAI